MKNFFHSLVLHGEQKQLTRLQEYYIIDLSKIRKIYKNIKQKGKEESLIDWCMFLEDPNSKEVLEIMNENEEIKKANEDLEKMSQDEELRKSMELYERIIMENEWDKKDAYEDGLKKGEEKGEKRGKAEGKKEGAKENTIKIAKEMLKMNLDLQTISKATRVI